MADRFKSNDHGEKLFTWGDADKGRLGHADQETKLSPTCVAQLVEHVFVQVSCGRMLTVGLTNKGIVYTMGSVVHGQLGNPQTRDKTITVVQGKLKHEFVREISSGSYHIAALTAKGNVYTWGKGANGQLGLGDTVDKNSPTLVEALTGRQVENVTCGSSSTAVICLHKSISGTDQLACTGCSMAFGFTRKKHNCYNCGLLFCRACTSKKVRNASLAPKGSKPVRVCNPCFNQLQRIPHSGRPSEMNNLSPRPLLIIQKAFSDGKEDRGDATSMQSQMVPSKNCCDGNSMCHERKTMKNEGENDQPLDPISYLSGGLPRWGQVPFPLLFREYGAEPMMINVPERKNPLYSVAHVCLQEVTQESTFLASAAINAPKDLTDSGKIHREEAQKLRAEAESLEELCQKRRETIKECQQRVEEAWSLAKEEAAKCKAAKEVIKALTSRLHTMSEKLSAGRETKDQVSVTLPQITSICTNSPTMKGAHPMFVATHEPPDVGKLEDTNVNPQCSSPILFSNTLLSMRNRDINTGDARSAEESCARRTDSVQDENKAMKLEWVEQYQPGVYITFITLPSGQKGLKRVRFRYVILQSEKIL
ncbi:unnamed protein product [Ilex paraguariensis]|uniref:FYVE-type domain-containing protein n=1 Tax=Ilex paraguariensis TaxID=185542 RepID=A0ABC8TQX0_9AQUA